MMKALVFATAIVLGLMLNVSNASAAEPAGKISNDVLAQMGLGGMQEVSDEEGMDVRGKGWGGWNFKAVFHHGHHGHHGHHSHGKGKGHDKHHKTNKHHHHHGHKVKHK